jgi:hypothetical protein
VVVGLDVPDDLDVAAFEAPPQSVAAVDGAGKAGGEATVACRRTTSTQPTITTSKTTHEPIEKTDEQDLKTEHAKASLIE